MMHQHTTFTKFTSSMEISNVNPRPQLVRPQTPGPEDRFSYPFKSLFTLADVAAKRRANGGLKKRTNKADENACGGGDPASSAFLRRSKSSGDVPILEENSCYMNADHETDRSEAPAKVIKGLRARAATTPHPTPSKIPKARSVAWSQAVNTSSEDSSCSSASTGCGLSGAGELSVDDAIFVLVAPPRTTKKVLTLAAHTPSLPHIASPFSPRTNQPCVSRPLRARLAAPCSSPGTGRTTASLHLTKSHWELRYETRMSSLSMKCPPAMEKNDDLMPTRSRFPPPLTNPALFPRAGSLTPSALRPLLDGAVAGEDARAALEVDWAMRAWPLDKIQRTLFVHDLDVRTCFPVSKSEMDYNTWYIQGHGEDPELEHGRVVPKEIGGVLRETEHPLRRWEWDWELRWRVIEDMAQDESQRVECEYDVFLAEDYARADNAYGDCDVPEGIGMKTMVDGDWEWREDAMEVDAML